MRVDLIENVVEAMVDAVMVVDLEGRVTLTNTAAVHITGYTADELRAMPVGKLLIDEASGLRTVVRRRIEHGDVLRREESWLITNGGERIPVSITGSPMLASDGALQGIVLVARDTREIRQLLEDKQAELARRERAEAELRSLNASIEQKLEQTRASLLLAERRATLGTLAGGVGHELRNIAQIQVAAIDELAGCLERGEDVEELAMQILPELERVAEHITSHGQQLMQLARPGPDHVEPLDLHGIIRDVIAMLQWAGKLRRLDVGLELGEEALEVSVNRTRIEQILVNLIGNAVDAIGDRPGSITIRVARRDGGRIRCEVADTGGGIEPAHLDKIFDPYFTTKPLGQGNGLGLSVVRQIVESYEGTLSVASELGRGTTFTFDLPAQR